MRTLYTLLAACFALTASAQRAKFSATEIDMGQISWHTEAVARIEVKNTGNRPLLITDVTTDCGCTVVNFDKAPIAPGHTSVISATYDAETLGTFAKYITVSTNASDAPTDILLTGCVQTRVIDYSQQFPFKVDNVLLSTDHIEFDDVNKGDLPQQTLLVLNNGKQNYVPELMHLPPYLTSTVVPETLSPGKTGRITVTLNSSKLRDFGLLQTAVYLANVPGEKVSSDNEVSVSTVLLPSFAGMDIEQRQYAPQLSLSTDRLEMTFGKKKKMTGEVTLSNRGRTALKISSLQLFTPGLRVTLAKREVAPGETVKMKITGYRDELKGLRTRPRVLMITNDPAMPKVTIEVKMKD